MSFRVLSAACASVLVTLAFCAGCGASPAMRAAERGDLAALRVEIGAREKKGDLSNCEAAAIARETAEREVRAAKGDDAAKRVREVRACTGELEGVLSERMKTHDAAGADAAMALVDDGKLSPSKARAWVGDADEGWRAVGARGLVREEDRAARAAAMLDTGPRVRRAAMRAAQDAKDDRDFDALVEAARLDPEPILRTEALRALVRLHPSPLLVTRLRDLWQGADDALREDIASAYALPGIYAVGGREALNVLIASTSGPGAIAGAGAVLRAPHVSKELREVAVALVARTIEDGTRRDRMHALAVADTGDPRLVEAAKRAAREQEGDAQVRVAALARLAGIASERAAAVVTLEAIAGKKDDEGLASRARSALAHAGDLRVQAWIERDLAAPSPEARVSAAGELAALGRAARGAPLLADADPSVRTRAACALITAARIDRR